MKRFLTFKGIFLTLGTITFLGGLAFFFVRSLLQIGSQPTEARTTAVIKSDLIQTVTIPGSLMSVRSTTINVPFDGYIKKIYVKLGQKVKAFDPLVSVVQSLQHEESLFPIRAPFAGVVTLLPKSEGQYSSRTDPKDFIMRIDDLSQLFVRATVPELDVNKIAIGLEAKVRVSAIMQKTYHGKVHIIDLAATPKDEWGYNTQVEYMVRIELTDADAQLKPSMSAVVDIITTKRLGVPALPFEFVHKKEDGQYMATLKSGEVRNIKVGLAGDSMVEIIEGLELGDEIRQVDFLKLTEKKK